MQVYVNDKLTETRGAEVLSDLLANLEIGADKGRKGIAVAVDNEVIARDQWKGFRLKEFSKIVIITATQGG